MNYVKEIRLELGMTQAALADVLGISRATISLVEADIRTLSSDNIVKLGKLKLRSLQESTEEIDGMKDIVQERKLETQRYLEAEIERMTIKLAKEEQILRSMRRKYSAAAEALKLIRKELEIFRGVEDYEKRLMTQQQVQQKIYINNHPSARKKHEVNILALQNTVAIYRQELENLIAS